MFSRWACAALALPLAWVPFSSADTITFTLTDEFSGAQQPLGSLTATFLQVADDNADGGLNVQLTLTSALVSSEFVTEWDFNFANANIGVGSLSISPAGTNTIVADDINTGVDGFKADGDGFYDIQFLFANNGANQFGTGDGPLVYIFDGGSVELSAANFNQLSKDDGGHGPFTTAAHVQGVGTNAGGSGWIAPDPTTGGPLPPVPLPLAAIGGAFLMGLVSLKRRPRATV